MDMTDDAIQKLADLGADASNPIFLKPDAEPAHVYYVGNREKGLEKKLADLPPHDHRAGDIPTVVKRAVDWKSPGDDPAVAHANVPVSIWYSRLAVVAVCGRDRCTLGLQYSDPMKALIEFSAQPKTFKQPNFIKLIRTVFRDALPALALLEPVRKIKWRTGETGESAVGHGKASIGRAAESELTGQKEIPEYVTFNVPVFTSCVTDPMMVECAVEIDAVQTSFQILPLPGAIENAIALAENILRGQVEAALGSEKIPVYLGTP